MGICASCRRRERKAPEKRSLPGAGGPAKGAAAAELLPRRLDRLPMMANSIKQAVSKRRRRYMQDGFNLDLAYITDRLIAMGFPAEKLEGVYRNHIDEVVRFLETRHKDHYKIYNLCSERTYDKNKFHARVERYAFEDHTPPNMDIIKPFCESVDTWLSADAKNVAAVHCKAGKGRTGTMVCCYLLYSKQLHTADEALKFYGTKRAHDNKGVTIPSQRRYVEYYAWLLSRGVPYVRCRLHIRELLMTPPPPQHAAGAVPELVVTQAHPFLKIPMSGVDVRRADGMVRVQLSACTPLAGDVRLDVYHKHKMKRKEKLFHFWFNTFFLTAGGPDTQPMCPLPDSPNLETFKLTLSKNQLDDAHKDKQNKNTSEHFKVELIVQKMPDSCTFEAARPARGSPSASSASSCSSAPPSDPEHWDSGEPPPPPPGLTALAALAPSPAAPGADYDTGLGPYDSAVARGEPMGQDTGFGPYDPALGGVRGINHPSLPSLAALADPTLGPGEPRALISIPYDPAVGPFERVSDTAVRDHKSGLVDSSNDSGLDRTRYLAPGHRERFRWASRDPSPLRPLRAETGHRDSPKALGSKFGGPARDPLIPDFEGDLLPSYEESHRKNFFGANLFPIYGIRSDNPHLEGSRKSPATVKESPTLNPLYQKDTAPTINPLYCSNAGSVRESPEPMDYSSDVFSSAPPSARESPVEDKKRTEDKKPRLSLGDMKATWKEFSGIFAPDSRRKKDDS